MDELQFCYEGATATLLHLSRRRRCVVCGCLVLVFNCNVCNICHRVQVTPVWVPGNNGKEVPRWGVAEIQKMSF